jgi:ATP synthase protein I
VKPDPEKLRKWSLLAGIGPLLAASVLVGYLVGSWLDRRFGTDPWGLIACVLLGMAGGFLEMVRLLRDLGEQTGGARRRRSRGGPGAGGGKGPEAGAP